MAKVYMFPEKKKLPKCVEEHLHEIAKEYVGTIRSAVLLMDLERDKPTQEEMMELIGTAFAEGITKAIEELDEL